MFPDWPLMNGAVDPAACTDANSAHVLHRWVAVVVGLIVWATALAAWRTQRVAPVDVRLALTTAVLFTIQAIVGGLQVLTGLAAWTQTLHLALGAVIWGLAAALAVVAYFEARTTVTAASGLPARGGRPATTRARGRTTPGAPDRRPAGDTVRAYIALTKPRIIELLLVTTIPAMVLATRELPGMAPAEWFRLAFWTLICGTLAAGSANAINQYLDRDIDLLMTRTRRRPLPAHAVTPENARGLRDRAGRRSRSC